MNEIERFNFCVMGVVSSLQLDFVRDHLVQRGITHAELCSASDAIATLLRASMACFAAGYKVSIPLPAPVLEVCASCKHREGRHCKLHGVAVPVKKNKE
jgi:hypothetical protein